jgi:hypothetical protein
MTIVQVCSRKMRAAGDQQQQEAMSINFFEVLSLEGTHSFRTFSSQFQTASRDA